MAAARTARPAAMPTDAFLSGDGALAWAAGSVTLGGSDPGAPRSATTPATAADGVGVSVGFGDAETVGVGDGAMVALARTVGRGFGLAFGFAVGGGLVVAIGWMDTQRASQAILIRA
jgi:hypothetical protein